VLISAIEKISDRINKISVALCVFLLGALTVVTFAQIVCRVFFTALSWSEEAARYLLVWATMLGAGCVYKAGSHISVTVVQDLLPPVLKKYAKLLVQLLCMLVFAVIVVYGARYVKLLGRQKSSAFNMPIKYMYASIPMGGAIMFIHALVDFWGLLSRRGGEGK